MRDRFFLLLAAGALATAGFVGCGDGEEGGGGGTGGGGTGGGGTGGTGGSDVSTECPQATFTTPAANATLTASQDKDGDCSNGINLDVLVATNAPPGTSASLLADGAPVATGTVVGATVKFSDVQLKSSGATKLAVRFASDPKCDVEIDVTSQCSDVGCDIAKPVLSATHPKLNGVPASQGGDRVSADGQDYQAAFEVTTTIEDGQPVTLTVDGKAQAAVAVAQGGLAKFPGVTLTPDGDHKVSATCTALGGKAGSSAEVTYPVDSAAPDLSNLVPADGHFFGPTDDSNTTKSGLQFEVCGETAAPDAIDLPASLGAGQQNFCVGIGTSTPTCAAATGSGANGQKGGCVELDCPGGAPFDLKVTLTDEAGNPTTKTISGVKCASTLPSVQIIEPVSGTGADVTTHILAATATQTRKDQDPTKPKAQYTVVACTDVAGGAGKLKVGLAGGALAEAASAVAVPAQSSDNCPTGFGNVLKFTNATLEESAMDINNALLTATRLVVEVQDVSTATGTSPAVDVWVDSEAPAITEWFPVGLCGKLYQSAVPVQETLGFFATNVPIQGTVTNGSGTQTFSGTASAPGGVTISPQVTFALGTNSVAVTTTEPSGNTGALKSPCTVTVGNPPIVTWTSPTTGTLLNASTDGGAAAGWQGTLTVQTDVGGSGGTVTFKVDCGGTVTTLGTANIDGAGVATLSNQTIPDCASAKIIAETSNITGKGVGTSTLTKVVDTVVPNAPTGLIVSVKDRRATTFALAWTAPSDGGQSVGGYQVRVSKAPITAANFDAAESVTYGGTPKAPGGAETLDVTNRIIENDYYFALAAVDAGGNRSSIVSAGPAKATFNSAVLSGSGTEAFGFAIDGSTSINGDGLADLVVGARNAASVRIYFGKAGGYTNTPDVTISGTAGTRFGFTTAVVGDVDADGLADIAVSAPIEASKGRIYIFKGRATWPANLTAASADYTIDVDTVADAGFTNGQFGYSIAPLGDFDGDGAADFAVGAYVYQSGRGYVAVIRGGTTGAPFTSVTLPADVGTKAYAFIGDAAFGTTGWFGQAAVGLGSIYSGGVPALVVGAPGASAGVVYSFKGGAGLPATTQATSAFEKYTGSGALRTGNPLTNLGNGVGVGSPATSGSVGGDGRLFFANATVFGSTLRTLTNSQATISGDQFGNALAGGAFSGSTATVSLIGGSDPDVAVSSMKLAGATPAKLYIVEGSKLTADLDVVTQADVVYTLPSDWNGSGWRTSAIRDSNGDGYPELAVCEQGNALNYAGRVIVLW